MQFRQDQGEPLVLLPLNHLLLPFDFSERSTAMIRYALELARRYQARATILHVLDVPPAIPDSPLPDAFALLGMTEELQERMHERLMNHQFPFDVPDTVRRLTMRGVASETILRCAQELDASLIAMATRGRGGLSRFLLGSTVAKVLDRCTLPVLTGTHLDEDDLSKGFARILCAVDLESHSAATLEAAGKLARDLGAELHLGTAIEVEDMKVALNFGSDWERYALERARDRLHELQSQTNIDCALHARIGEPSKVIPHLAASLHPSLMVIGRSVKGNGPMERIGGMLRTNAYALIRESPCPVLSV
jgi:nucleotide-binding universal stress UspA family protein